MSNKRRNRRVAASSRRQQNGKARAKTVLAANVTEEHDWYLDEPDVRLTRIFVVVLLLHAVAFGGIMAFKMVDKASSNTAITITSSREAFEDAVSEERSVSAAAPSAADAEGAPAEAAARPRPPAPLRRDPDAENAYRVQAGESLPEIAEKMGVTPEALRQANAIRSDNELYPGRWLISPADAERLGRGEAAEEQAEAAANPPLVAEPVGAPAASESGDAASGARVYEVVSGDTPWGIARKLNVSFNELMQLNGIDRPETLQIGQKLRVPPRQ